MKRKLVPTAVIAVAIAALMLSGCGQSDGGASSASSQEGQNQQVTYVEVMNTSENTIKNEYLYSGTIQPIEEVTVAGTIQGKVASVNYDVGDYVNAGDTLYTMDTSDILNNKRVAEANLASAEASIQSAQTNLDLVNGATMQSQIEAAKSALDNAQVAYNTAKTNYDNNKVLFENGIISQTEMNQYSDALSNAEIAYNQAKQTYDLTLQMPEENKRKAEDSLNSALAARESVVAQINSYNKSLSDAVVTSPISGYVTECNVEAGTVLSASTPFKIVDTSKVTMDVSVSEELINSLKVGDTVSVSVPAVSASSKTGTISIINPAANSGGTYDVRIEMDNADGTLKSGMFGEVNFVKDQSDNNIVLPVNSVITRNGETYVFVYENGVAVKTNVETGINNGNEIEITSGLEPNMEVVVKGQTYIDDGTPIAIESQETPASDDSAVSDSASGGDNSSASQNGNAENSAGQKEE